MIIDAVFKSGIGKAYTPTLSQYDKGVRLRFIGINLPDIFEVHFSNQHDGGVATVVEGKNYIVGIPDAYLINGDYVYAWVCKYGKSGVMDYDIDIEEELITYNPNGESVIDPNQAVTEYLVTIPVKRRPAPVVMPTIQNEHEQLIPGLDAYEDYDYDIDGENLVIRER